MNHWQRKTMPDHDLVPEEIDQPQAEDGSADIDAQPVSAAGSSTRRGFLGESARKLTYAAPVVMLFKPRAASASGGTQITP
jgi:hypothetical protein